ncbi:MAG: hypothetical protein KAX31_04485, partial [Thermoplasmata archaeon]|nr:hypothetical protein [Thermoplasmata archaeon]
RERGGFMMSEWENTKERLEQLEKEPDNRFVPALSGFPSKSLLDHALFAKALRLIMEKLEDT